MKMKMNENPRGAAIYLLPNLLTTAGLFAGFYAVVAAMKTHFDIAAIAIFVAMVMDTMDGRVARLTNTASEFGAQFDSLSDMVAFGIAPALVVYSWVLFHFGKVGWLVAFFYAAATALRLARFNVQSDEEDKRYFRGLPCPAAAGTIAGIVWVGHLLQSDWLPFKLFVAVLTGLLGVLMVSNLRYYSFKEVDFKGRVPFLAVFAVVLIFVAVAVDPPQVLFGVFFLYALSGPAVWLWRRRKALNMKGRKAARKAKKTSKS